MDKKLTKNYFYTILYQILIVITPFITDPYLTRTIGKTSLSINDMTYNIVQWFILFGIMGVNTYGNREIARVRDNKKELSKTFFEILTMQVISMLLSVFAFLIFFSFFSSPYKKVLLIQAVTLLSVSVDITWFFYGVEDFKKAALRNAFIKILNIILLFIFIKTPDDIYKFVIINVSLSVLAQLIMWTQLHEYINFEKISIDGVIRHIRPNLALFVPQIAISIYSLLDVSMMSVLNDEIGSINLYRQAQQFVKMFLFFITSIGSVMLPRISNAFQKNEMNQINKYLQTTFRIALYLAIPMIVGIFGVIQGFIDWFLPADYVEVGLMIKMTSPIILFISISNVYGLQYMVPIGEYKKYTRSAIIGAIVNFTLNYLLIKPYGAYGAIIASVIAEFSVALSQYLSIRNKLRINVEMKELFKIIFSSLMMLIPIYFVNKYFDVRIFSTFVQILVGFVTYLISLYVTKANLFIQLLSNVKRGVKYEA